MKRCLYKKIKRMLFIKKFELKNSIDIKTKQAADKIKRPEIFEEVKLTRDGEKNVQVRNKSGRKGRGKVAVNRDSNEYEDVHPPRARGALLNFRDRTESKKTSRIFFSKVNRTRSWRWIFLAAFNAIIQHDVKIKLCS
ncbi:hypothetical protein CEXT_114971 [Caerostris extrusa]|uniref:Uncharacterized protein n=1 Tax=Caerostris extrusa TaxID=172846 RepID=A0AAV4VRF1_CAEEX|nr:hypothetical protein CEXT_114971 [Caerostris extrusa]